MYSISKLIDRYIFFVLNLHLVVHSGSMNAAHNMVFFVTDDTKEYVKIFTNIERLDQLQSYYIRCHKVCMVVCFNNP